MTESPVSPELRALLVRAATAFNGGDHPTAVNGLKSALAINPRLGQAHLLMGDAQFAQGHVEDAEASYRNAVDCAPDSAQACNNLGAVLQRQNRLVEAIPWYERAVAVQPDLRDAHHNLAGAFAACGRWTEALTSYSAAIALRPDFIDAHINMGNVLIALGRPEDAVASFRAAIVAREDCAGAHFNLGNALASLGRREEAMMAYRRALAAQADFVEAYDNLGLLLLEAGNAVNAAEVWADAIDLNPKAGIGHYRLGNALRRCGRPKQAVAAYRKALDLDPDDAEIHITLANMLIEAPGQADEAYALFRRAHHLCPVRKRPAIVAKPDLAVLFLSAPGFTQTPAEYITAQAEYDSYAVTLLSGVEYDLNRLRECAGVVVNLVSDADSGRDILAQLAAFVEALARPVVNHPRMIIGTGREDIAARLQNIPGCRVPKTIRLAGVPSESELAQRLAGFAFPVLVRMSGAHGGEHFEKLDDRAAVSAFIGKDSEAEYYVTQYAPYESADGYFRKYRLIFVDGEIFPYHLAIADQWKVHHFRTDMANRPWMQAEEEAFVRDPTAGFGPARWAALEQIRARVGLDYFGIDCGLDRHGDLVVFEVNATMLVHGEDTVFAYKQPFIARIKKAFDAMLRKKARAGFTAPGFTV